MKYGFILSAVLCAGVLLSVTGCGGGGDEVIPAPVATTEESGVPEGMSDAEYAKAMAESMK